MNKTLFTTAFTALVLALPGLPAHAQTTTTATAASPGKKALVARILKIQQPGIDGMSRALVERPAITLLDNAGAALQERVPADKRDAIGKDIQADVKKYLDEAIPLVTKSATKLAPSTIGALLEDKFTEDELKQVATILETPAFGKYQKLSLDMQKVLMEKVLADTRGVVEPKVVALEDAVAKRLGISAPATANPAK